MPRFHSTKEGFKVRCIPSSSASNQVSIPPRKVSRFRGAAPWLEKLERFPFHQGRFQGSRAGNMTAACVRFHSTKEGFKAGPGTGGLEMHRRSFHSTKEGFKVIHQNVVAGCDHCFHSTKEGFKALGQPGDSRAGNSFHSTKEGFKELRRQEQDGRGQVFPFHQGRFQGPSASSFGPPAPVSIPPRKVSRDIRAGIYQNRWRSFHSTKEGFKADSADGSIPFAVCFHSTKEGFKAPARRVELGGGLLFPFHQGRFQGRPRCPGRPP